MTDTPLVPNKILVNIALGLGVALLSSLSYWYYSQRKQHRKPLQWRRVGTLSQLNIYPLKSCAPLSIPENELVECDILGLRWNCCRDRALMLIDSKNQMVSGRQYAKCVLIHTQMLNDSKLVFTAPDMEPLELDFATVVEQAHGKDVYTAVFDAKIDALLCGERYDKWFSRFLLSEEQGMRLVYYPYKKPVRAVNMRMINEPLANTLDTGAFCNATSYMLINSSSVNDLNTRLKKPAHPLQFRGSFYLKMDTDEAYAEDHWKWIRIGDKVVFRVVAPCTRCIFPTVNIFTGERDADGEPLKTLRSYRQWKNYAGPTLGLQLGLREAGSIKANDVIYVDDDPLERAHHPCHSDRDNDL